jgi:hypothetical protein
MQPGAKLLVHPAVSSNPEGHSIRFQLVHYVRGGAQPFNHRGLAAATFYCNLHYGVTDGIATMLDLLIRRHGA